MRRGWLQTLGYAPGWYRAGLRPSMAGLFEKTASDEYDRRGADARLVELVRSLRIAISIGL